MKTPLLGYHRSIVFAVRDSHNNNLSLCHLSARHRGDPELANEVRQRNANEGGMFETT